MNQSDAAEFYAAMDLSCGMLSKKVFDESVLKGYFSLLAQYPIADIKASLNTLICSSDSQYGIRPDLIIKYMGIKESKPETVEGVLAKSKAKNSPLGIVASRAITKWDHGNLNNFDLRQKAAEFIELLPNIEQDIQENGYEDHTLRLMVQYGVDPTSDFRDGVSGPNSEESTRIQYKAMLIEDKRQADAKQASELRYQVSLDEERAHNEELNRQERKLKPELWAKFDALRAEGKVGEAMRLIMNDAMIDHSGPTDKQIDSDQAVYDRLMNKAVEK